MLQYEIDYFLLKIMEHKINLRFYVTGRNLDIRHFYAYP